ncbi:MAG: helix-turn-helix transcriptional regulator [Acidobacteriota bacterium]|nr:helix-turn-helix domain-containing protein [Blastocatellia bacterium]MDW8411138.1 helix-turn-helix transcriptional regulator [Acidobacteriota bacterium]
MNLKVLRIACRLTLREAAKLTNVSYETLYRLEQGEPVDAELAGKVKDILEALLRKRSRSCRS